MNTTNKEDLQLCIGCKKVSTSSPDAVCASCSNKGIRGEADTQEQPDLRDALDELVGKAYQAGRRPSDFDVDDSKKETFMRLVEADRERASLDAQQALLDRLDKEIFYSKADPAGQYVKDCISEERTKLEKERNLLCQQNS